MRLHPLLLALALLAGGCSRGGAGEPESGVREIALRADGLPPGDEPLLVRSLVPPDGLAPWTVAGGPARVIRDPRATDGEGEPLLVIYGSEHKEIVIPGPFPSHSFNRVVLHLSVVEAERVYLQASVQGRVALGSESAEVPASSEPVVCLLDLPQARRVERDLDELRIHVAGQGGQIAVQRVDLVLQPLATWLPDPEGGPRLVQVGDEHRRGVRLSSRRPLRGRFEAGRGEVLTFSYGAPERLRSPGRRQPALRVVLRGERGGKIVRRLPLGPAGDEACWASERIPLDDLAGEVVEASWELEARDEREALCAVAEVRAWAPRRDPTTVLLITSDTHRAEYLGVADLGVTVETPHLDRLAAGGVLFEDCFSSTNVTNPSHVALMTAVHPRDTGVLDNTTRLLDTAPTLAERFRAAGFATLAAVSARHLGHDESGLGQGFQRMSWPGPEAQRDSSATIDALLGWLPEVEGSPLFVWLHVFDAHTPYARREPFIEHYYPPGVNPYGPDVEPDHPLEDSELPVYLRGLKDLHYAEAMYRSEVSYLDQELARVMELPRFRAGVLAFTADHGESFWEHHIYFDHADLFPNTIHVPLLLRYPGGPAGLRVARPVRQIDIGRTLLDRAGLEGAEFPGRDLSATPAEAGPYGPRFALACNRQSASINVGGWHMIVQLTDHAEELCGDRRLSHCTQLFDLRADPGCERDLLDEELERARRMRAALVRWLCSGEARHWGAEGTRDPRILADLARLGYTPAAGEADAADLIDPDCACDWCARFE